MAGDYTRFTFDPREHHAGVLMQQGRVQLDADWNELVELLDRRWRAETVDIIGRCVVPRETPRGFEILVSGGSMTIGIGRAYVDGLLAENHGLAPLQADTMLGEVRGTQAVPYTAQPYFPNPPALLPGARHLAYLDVWQREITALEEPDLVDAAVGVDTATRIQTVWQVKVLPRVGPNVTCETPDEQVPGWLDATRPSAGRLTTQAVGIPSTDDPCVIPPSGGYRGVENRLYRVEIHHGGPMGTATFKWSRDNASIATTVTALNAARTQLTVVRTGRDATLRFSPGDWVEVTDDWRELNGLPGEMRKIAGPVDDVRQIIPLDVALPAGAFDPTDATRHTRVRRWDQKGVAVDAAGGVTVVPAASAPVVLEDGVQITFSTTPGTGSLRSGDYWAFAARTPDGSVEILTDAPPRGIHHHYCRLALITLPDTELDCRTFWPPEHPEGGGCDCTVCVSPESHNTGVLTIQQAVEQVRVTGGKVCLLPGQYFLRETVRVTGAQSVRIEGHGWRTMLMHAGDEPALVIEQSIGVTVEGLAIFAALGREQSFGAAVSIRNCVGVDLQRCVFVQLGEDERRARLAVALGGYVLGGTIRENVILCDVGVAAIPVQRGESIAQTPMITAFLRIQDNVFWCDRLGVSLAGFAVHLAQTTISGNFVNGCSNGGLVVGGIVSSAGFPGSRLDVTGNVVRIRGRGDGIVVGTDNARIDGNDVAGVNRRSGNDGIVLMNGADGTGIDRGQVLANRITEVGGDGISIRGHIGSAMIKNNFVEGVGGNGIAMEPGASADHLSVENNELLNIAPEVDEGGEDARLAFLAGIRLIEVDRAHVAGNQVHGVGRNAVRARGRTGIQLVATSSGAIAGNEVSDIGPPQFGAGEATGIDVVGPFDRVDVSDNVVRRSTDGAPAMTGPWFALQIGEPEIQRPPVANLTLVAFPSAPQVVDNVGSGGRGQPPVSVFVVTTDRVKILAGKRDIVAVRGNLLEAAGSAPAVAVRTPRGDCALNDNRCLLTGPGEQPVVIIVAGALLANANVVRGGGEISIRAGVNEARFAAVSNIVTGVIDRLEDRWIPMNIFNAGL